MKSWTVQAIVARWHPLFWKLLLLECEQLHIRNMVCRHNLTPKSQIYASGNHDLVHSVQAFKSSLYSEQLTEIFRHQLQWFSPDVTELRATAIWQGWVDEPPSDAFCSDRASVTLCLQSIGRSRPLHTETYKKNIPLISIDHELV